MRTDKAVMGADLFDLVGMAGRWRAKREGNSNGQRLGRSSHHGPSSSCSQYQVQRWHAQNKM